MLNWFKNHPYLSISGLILLGGLIYFLTHRAKPVYESFVVSTGEIRDTLELSGKVTASGMATLRFPTGGLVTYLGPQEGDRVAKWQTLASLDVRQTQKILDQKLNLYAIQRGTFEQTIDDNDNSVPGGDLGRTLTRLLEKNQYQLDNTVKDVEYQDLTLKLSRLSSPLTGILVKSPIKTANVQVIATDTWVVVDPTTLYFSADLDETDLTRVQVGQPVEIVLDAYNDQVIKSEVSSIAYTPKETTSGTVYELKLMIPEADMQELRLGLNGVATLILTSKPNTLILPSNAITYDGSTAYVYVQEGGKYLKRNLEIGIENDGMTEILSGVNQDEQVYIQKSE